MERMKTFAKYLIMFVLFYIFVSFASAGFIKNTYNDIEGNIQALDSIAINVNKAEATMVNGHITGTISNNTDVDEQLKYIKIDLISSRDNTILTKYIQVDELKSGETCNFTINFEAENIKKYNITITDEYVKEESNAKLINLKDAENEEIKNISIFVATIILLKYVIL